MTLIFSVISALILFVGLSATQAGEIYDLKPLVQRYELMESLRDSRFAADFDTPDEREKFVGYKQLIMDCQERIKVTAQLLQLYNIFATEEGLEVCADYVGERIGFQAPKFIAETKRDIQVLDDDLRVVENAALLQFGRTAVMLMNGYVSDFQSVVGCMDR